MHPVYTVSDGVRRVRPYYHEYRTPFKLRWTNKTVPEVLVSELGQSSETVHHGIDSHMLFITKDNGKKGGPVDLKGPEVYTRKLRPHDVIHNLQHMHEPCVLWVPSMIMDLWYFVANLVENLAKTPSILPCGVTLLYSSEEMVVVCKPGGIPTHPGGIYRYNTLVEIVSADLDCPVWPCHRLDKATLGVVILAKTKDFCRKLMLAFSLNRVEKQYLARVSGKFQRELFTYRCPLFSVNSSSGYLSAEKVAANTQTRFTRVCYMPEKDESIVLCEPLTGKMHQIRIHLSLLGHPISNDRYYNGVSDYVSSVNHEIERLIYESLFLEYPGFSPYSTSSEMLPLVVSLNLIVTPELSYRLAELARVRKERDLALRTGVCEQCLLSLYAEHPDLGIYLHSFKLIFNQLLQRIFLQKEPPLFSLTSPAPSWCPADKIS